MAIEHDGGRIGLLPSREAARLGADDTGPTAA